MKIISIIYEFFPINPKFLLKVKYFGNLNVMIEYSLNFNKILTKITTV